MVQLPCPTQEPKDQPQQQYGDGHSNQEPGLQRHAQESQGGSGKEDADLPIQEGIRTPPPPIQTDHEAPEAPEGPASPEGFLVERNSRTPALQASVVRASTLTSAPLSIPWAMERSANS